MSNETRGTREFDEDGFHEIQLSGKQLVFLCMATTVVSIVIFLCGVLVGRGVRPVEPVAEAATAQATEAPVEAPPAPQPAPHKEPAPTPPPAATTAPPPAPAATAKPAASAPAPAAAAAKPAAKGKDAGEVNDTPPPDELSYYDELSRKGGAKPGAKPTATPPAAAEKPAATPAAPAAAPVAAAKSGGGPIAVQVGALKSRADAEALARRLSGKGYAAYVVSPEAGGPSVFKVRVGNYTNADEAARVKKRLETEEKLKPWIIR